MGREVRRVRPDWQHPTDGEYGNGEIRYKPLHEGYKEAAEDFMEMANSKGLQEAVDYFGQAPDKEEYMPDWTDEEATHYQMYEDTTEGTPISPPMASPEELARWLVDNNASAIGGETASYEAWLRVANSGFACSGVISSHGLESGVEAMARG